jgi:hypothetical protein
LSFEPGARSRDQQIRLGGDGSRDLGAERFRLRLGFVARQRLQASGEDERLAGDGRFLRLPDHIRRRDPG